MAEKPLIYQCYLFAIGKRLSAIASSSSTMETCTAIFFYVRCMTHTANKQEKQFQLLSSIVINW